MKSVTLERSAVVLRQDLASGEQAINQLDLGPIKVKLMEREEGEGWSLDQVNTVEKWYKRFLLLNLKYPSASIVPNAEIDTFWHYHILDTQKYAEDCGAIFGRFLHHFPYFGMRGAEDAKNLERDFGSTEELFLAEFGEPIGQMRAAFSPEDLELPAGSGNGMKCKAGNCRSCKGSVCKSVMDNIRPVFAG